VQGSIKNFVENVPTCTVAFHMIRIIPTYKFVRAISTLVSYFYTAKRCFTLSGMYMNFSYIIQQCDCIAQQNSKFGWLNTPVPEDLKPFWT